MTGAGGQEIWSSSAASEPLKPTPDGALIAVVPLDSGIGARGTYEFTVFGRPATGPPRLLATIPFAVRRP